MNDLTWSCHICKETRPDSKISVFSKDTSKEYNLPPGTMNQNVRYCNDNQSCIAEAPTFSFNKKSKEIKPEKKKNRKITLFDVFVLIFFLGIGYYLLNMTWELINMP